MTIESRPLEELPTSEIMTLYARADSELLRVRQFTQDVDELVRLTKEFEELEEILIRRIRTGD